MFVGQFLVALCFAEMAGQFPLAGSVYQWSKQVARPVTSWFAGWIILIGAIVTVAAVAVAYQVILPQISTDVRVRRRRQATSACTARRTAPRTPSCWPLLLVVFTTIINMIGVKVMAMINNIGVMVELVGATLLVIFLAFHVKRGPAVILHTNGTGDGRRWGYLGAFLLAGLASAYIFYGFDTAGSLAEETNNPRKHAPGAILRAMFAAFVVGGLLILFAMMAHEEPRRRATRRACPYIVKYALGSSLGDVFLVCSAIAITVCALAVHTAGIRIMFTMARDGRLPFGSNDRAGVRQVQDPDRAGAGHRRADHRAAGAQHRQPAGVLRADVGGDHPVLHRLPLRHRPDADPPAAGRVAAAEPRPVLLARAVRARSSTSSPSSTRRRSRSTWPGRGRTSTGTTRPGTCSTARSPSSALVVIVGGAYYFIQPPRPDERGAGRAPGRHRSAGRRHHDAGEGLAVDPLFPRRVVAAAGRSGHL